MSRVKLKRTKTVVETVDFEYPDNYPADQSSLGQAVDAMLKDLDYISDPAEFRLGIYDDDADRVIGIVAKLDKFYECAKTIHYILTGKAL